MTLRKIAEEHPDWLDYDVVVYREDGEYDYVGCSGNYFLADIADEDGSNPQTLVVFSGN